MYDYFSEIIFNIISRINWIGGLFIILIIGTIITLFLSIKYKNNQFYFSIWIGLFISFIQIIITVFVMEKILDRYQKEQWRKTTFIVQKMVRSELKEDLVDIVYMMDFSDYRIPHNLIESRLERKQGYTNDEIIHAAEELLKIININDYADHKRYKKKDDIFSYQIDSLKQFASKMESNLINLEKIIGFSQINISSSYYNEIIECRNEYKNIITSVELYSRFLGASEITGQIIDYNLNFELKYRNDMYTSLIKTMNIIIKMLKNDYSD